ncbi:hypothetical protein ABEF95_008083 [Exophiala dermatitidis]
MNYQNARIREPPPAEDLEDFLKASNSGQTRGNLNDPLYAYKSQKARGTKFGDVIVEVMRGSEIKRREGNSAQPSFSRAATQPYCNVRVPVIQSKSKLAGRHGVKVKAYQVEVSNPSQVQQSSGEVIQDFGRLDAFVADAGVAISKPILEQTLDEYRKQIISAHIINVPVDQPVYNATKAAVTHLGKSLAREWRNFARVNVVSSGFFHAKMGAPPACENEANRMTVLGRQGHVRELKGLYLYLASDASSFQTGSDVLIDGGYTLP